MEGGERSKTGGRDCDYWKKDVRMEEVVYESKRREKRENRN